MVIAFTLYPEEEENIMPAAMNSVLFWSAKPHYMDQIKTTSQEWEYFERQKEGLERWCRAAEAKKKMAMVGKVISCRCL